MRDIIVFVLFRRDFLRITAFSLGMLLVGVAVLQADTDPPADDRSIALWVLRKGGRVLLDGAAEYTADPFDLPQQAFHIVGVDMHGTLVTPKDLEPLSKLTELRDVNLPGRVWTPASGTSNQSMAMRCSTTSPILKSYGSLRLV